MHERYAVVHDMAAPYYGAVVNAFSSIRNDMPCFSHVVVCRSPFGDEVEEAWVNAVKDLRARCDQLYLMDPDDPSEGLYDDLSAFAVVKYDSRLGCTHPRMLDWGIESAAHPSRPYTAFNPSPEPSTEDSRKIYPMTIVGRLKSVAGVSSVRTVGVLFSPFSPQSLAVRTDAESMKEQAARALSDTGPAGRVLCSSSVSSDKRESGGIETRDVKWCIGHEWKVGAICDVVVASLPSDGSFPFVLTSCMAEGRACVAVYDGNDPPPCYVKDSVNALVCSAKEEDGVYNRVKWLLSNPDKALALATNAQVSSWFLDRDPNLIKVRRVLTGGI